MADMSEEEEFVPQYSDDDDDGGFEKEEKPQRINNIGDSLSNDAEEDNNVRRTSPIPNLNEGIEPQGEYIPNEGSYPRESSNAVKGEENPLSPQAPQSSYPYQQSQREYMPRNHLHQRYPRPPQQHFVPRFRHRSDMRNNFRFPRDNNGFRPRNGEFRTRPPFIPRNPSSQGSGFTRPFRNQFNSEGQPFNINNNGGYFPRPPNTQYIPRPQGILNPNRSQFIPQPAAADVSSNESTESNIGNVFNNANDDIQMLYISENKEAEKVKIYDNLNIGEIYFEHFKSEMDENSASEEKSDSSRAFLDPKLIENLNKCGLIKLRPIQLAVMRAVFTQPQINPSSSRADILATSETGSGKSCAYLFPIVQKAIERSKIWTPERKRPMALIFANSNVLIQDIIKTLERLAADTDVKIARLAKHTAFIKDTYFDIGICTTGRFKNHYGASAEANRVQLDLSSLEYIVIDEADKMGKDSSFLGLLQNMKKEPKNSRIFAFSATMDEDMKHLARNTNVFYIKCGEHLTVAETITEYFWDVRSQRTSQVFGTLNGEATFHKTDTGPFHPFDTLYEALRRKKPLKGKKIMVFCKRTNVADFVALRLRSYGIEAASIHKESPNPDECLDAFKNGEINIIIVTFLLTRGYDTDVDVVINYDLPLDSNDYIHRCGRTGRNGKEGTVITFIDLRNSEDYNPAVVNAVAKRLIDKPIEKVPEFLRPMVRRLRDQMLQEQNAIDYDDYEKQFSDDEDNHTPVDE